ncbi:hypothetical protein, partial [Actinomadura sp.]|uniref:hypothetical protein n=1 Tax=Actinomadura sp. TaxID=1989 RepID=UPI0037C70CF8
RPEEARRASRPAPPLSRRAARVGGRRAGPAASGGEAPVTFARLAAILPGIAALLGIGGAGPVGGRLRRTAGEKG